MIQIKPQCAVLVHPDWCGSEVVMGVGIWAPAALISGARANAPAPTPWCTCWCRWVMITCTYIYVHSASRIQNPCPNCNPAARARGFCLPGRILNGNHRKPGNADTRGDMHIGRVLIAAAIGIDIGIGIASSASSLNSDFRNFLITHHSPFLDTINTMVQVYITCCQHVHSNKRRCKQPPKPP